MPYAGEDHRYDCLSDIQLYLGKKRVLMQLRTSWSQHRLLKPSRCLETNESDCRPR